MRTASNIATAARGGQRARLERSGLSVVAVANTFLVSASDAVDLAKMMLDRALSIRTNLSIRIDNADYFT